MPHWRQLMDDKEYLYHYDLVDRDGKAISPVVTIEKVVGGTLTSAGNKKSKKPIAYFVGKKKPLALNVTNCKTLEKITGSDDSAKWVGARITLFVTTTRSAEGETVKCIRIKPMAARGPDTPDSPADPEQPPQPEPPPEGGAS